MVNFRRQFCAYRAVLRATIFVAVCAWLAASLAAPAEANPFVRMDYNLFSSRARGTVFIELFDDRPLTKDNFLAYVNGGHYDNTVMHRMVRDFVIQGGGFDADIRISPAPHQLVYINPVEVDLDGNPNTNNPTVNNEYNNSPTRSNLKGTLAMAKVGPPTGQPPTPATINSATNQFFFNLSDNNASNLDNQNGGFTVFARVVGDGMNLIDIYNFVDDNGTPTDPLDDVPNLNIVNLNPDFNNNGTRDSGFPFTGVPVLGPNAQNGTPLILRNADRIDYLGAGLTTTVDEDGLAFLTRDAFIDTGTLFEGTGELIVGANRVLGVREGAALASRTVRNLGTLQPGLELGIVSLQGFRQDAGGTLEIQINGTTVDTGYDRLVINGAAFLGGTLDVSRISYNPQPGNTFTILTAGIIGGSFSDVNLPQLGLGLVWNYAQTNTSITLSVAAADFNRDGMVDASDYIIWSKNRNATGVSVYTRGDANGDGNVNETDYAIWRTNFGNTRGGSGGSGGQGDLAVPEPSSLALVLGGLACVVCRRSRREFAR